MLLHLMRSQAYQLVLPEHDIPVKLPAPINLDPAQFILWKMSPPRKPVVFQGKAEEYSPLAPHEARKVALDNETCTIPSIDVIGCTKISVTDENVQAFMRTEVTHRIQEMGRETPLLYESGEDSRARVHLAMWEGMLTMARAPAVLHINVPLNHSLKWDMVQEDPRYSELQVGDDCMLFRDWASVFLDKDKSHKCRLQAHFVHAESPIVTQIPWIRAQSNKLEWVTALSSHPLPPKIFRERQALPTMRSLLQCIQASKIIDTRTCVAPMSTYFEGNKIAISYNTSNGLKFIIFQR
jgi:hypothetical protein